MKRNLKGFIAGVIISGSLFGLCVPSIAAATRQVMGNYSGATIYLDGKRIAADPIEISGTTYLPLRTIGESLNLNVDWNGATKVITLTSGDSDNATPGANNSNVTVSGNKEDNISYQITYQNCSTRKDTYGLGVPYHAIVEIKNTGSANIYLKDATFDFEDKDGHLLETVSFISADPDIIAPGEKSYFYADGIFDVIEADTDFIFKPNLKVEKSKNDIIRYEISDTGKKVSNQELTITGRVKNTTEKDDPMVWVCFVLYREDGTPIIAGGTNVLDLGAGETSSFSRTFYASNLDVKLSDVASYKIFSNKVQYQF